MGIYLIQQLTKFTFFECACVCLHSRALNWEHYCVYCLFVMYCFFKICFFSLRHNQNHECFFAVPADTLIQHFCSHLRIQAVNTQHCHVMSFYSILIWLIFKQTVAHLAEIQQHLDMFFGHLMNNTIFFYLCISKEKWFVFYKCLNTLKVHKIKQLCVECIVIIYDFPQIVEDWLLSQRGPQHKQEENCLIKNQQCKPAQNGRWWTIEGTLSKQLYPPQLNAERGF